MNDVLIDSSHSQNSDKTIPSDPTTTTGEHSLPSQGSIESFETGINVGKSKFSTSKSPLEQSVTAEMRKDQAVKCLVSLRKSKRSIRQQEYRATQYQKQAPQQQEPANEEMMQVSKTSFEGYLQTLKEQGRLVMRFPMTIIPMNDQLTTLKQQPSQTNGHRHTEVQRELKFEQEVMDDLREKVQFTYEDVELIKKCLTNEVGHSADTGEIEARRLIGALAIEAIVQNDISRRDGQISVVLKGDSKLHSILLGLTFQDPNLLVMKRISRALNIVLNMLDSTKSIPIQWLAEKIPIYLTWLQGSVLKTFGPLACSLLRNIIQIAGDVFIHSPNHAAILVQFQGIDAMVDTVQYYLDVVEYDRDLEHSALLSIGAICGENNGITEFAPFMKAMGMIVGCIQRDLGLDLETETTEQMMTLSSILAIDPQSSVPEFKKVQNWESIIESVFKHLETIAHAIKAPQPNENFDLPHHLEFRLTNLQSIIVSLLEVADLQMCSKLQGFIFGYLDNFSKVYLDPQNKMKIWWLEGFANFVQIISSFIASATNECLESLFCSQILSRLFTGIFREKLFNFSIEVEVSELIFNVTHLDNDFCLQKSFEHGILEVIVVFLHHTQKNSPPNRTFAMLTNLDEILSHLFDFQPDLFPIVTEKIQEISIDGTTFDDILEALCHHPNDEVANLSLYILASFFVEFEDGMMREAEEENRQMVDRYQQQQQQQQNMFNI